MKITRLNHSFELIASTIHGVKRMWNENDTTTTIGMVVVGVGEMSLDGFLRRTLSGSGRGIPDNIIPLALQETASSKKRIENPNTKFAEELHIYFLPDLFSARAELVERFFGQIVHALTRVNRNIQHIILHGHASVCDQFVWQYFDIWVKKQSIELGIDELASNVSFNLDAVTDFKQIEEQIDAQLPDRDRGKDWFIGNNFQFVDSEIVMRMQRYILTRRGINRTVMSPKLTQKLFSDLVYFR